MGTLGSRFIEVSERLRRTSPTPSGAALTTLLQSLLDLLGESAPDGPPGGFLCLPGEPLALGVPVDLEAGQPLLRVPRHVTLWFPPGSVLVFPEGRAGPALEIDGALEATTQQLFACRDSLDGLVRFKAPPPAGILPEWFGAGLVPEGNDAPAFQAALRCAIDSSQRSGQTVTVELLREYLLRSTVQVSAMARTAGASVVLRGRCGVGHAWPATLYTLGSFVGAAMLDVDETVRFRMERVWLRSNLPGTPSPAPSCMNIQARSGRGALEVSCTQCRFDAVRGPAVHIEAPVRPTLPPPRVEFSSCGFRVHLEETGDAVELTAPAESSGFVQARFYNCRFEGFARAMIQGSCGHLLTEGCVFDNQKTPTSDGQGVPATGMDVALASTRISQRLEYLAVACSSQSGTFLRWRSPEGAGAAGATLVGVSHEALIATPDGPETPAIYWQAGTVMAALTLQGCAFLTRRLPRLETTPLAWTPIRVADSRNVQTVGVVNAWPNASGLVALRGSPEAVLRHKDLARADRRGG